LNTEPTEPGAPTPAPEIQAQLPGGKSDTKTDIVIKVGRMSDVKRTGTAIIHSIREGRQQGRQVVVRAIGSAALNQAVKALTFCRGILAQHYGVDLAFQTSFTEVHIDGELPDRAGLHDDGNRTAIVFHLLSLNRHGAL